MKPHIVHNAEGWRVARAGMFTRYHHYACHWCWLANTNRLHLHRR